LVGLISNHNSVRVLVDNTASVYFISEIYLHFSIGNGQPREPALCQLYSAHFRCRYTRSSYQRSHTPAWRRRSNSFPLSIAINVAFTVGGEASRNRLFVAQSSQPGKPRGGSSSSAVRTPQRPPQSRIRAAADPQSGSADPARRRRIKNSNL